MKSSYFSFLFFLAISASADLAAGATLRIACEGDAVGAVVLVNGQFKGECPVDVQTRGGTLKLRVQKKVDAFNERTFEQEIRLGDSEIKRVDVLLSAPKPAAASKPRETERLRVEKGDAKKREDERQRVIAEKQAQMRAEAKAQGIKLGSGNSFRDCTDCPEMIPIPGGNFEMGSPNFEAGRRDDEGPIRRVSIGPFALGKYAVTRGQFAVFVSETGYDAGEKCWTVEDGTAEVRSGRSWRNPGFQQDNSHPIVCVSWDDATAYAQWLSRKTGKTYRMPSEAEWEYAARAGTTTVRYWGDSADQACVYANVMDTTGKSQVPGVTWEVSCTDGHGYTAPVGSFKPNAFGLYDMLGNVWQWTQDCWHDNYDGAPTDGSAWSGGDCERHAVRGGSWLLRPVSVRAAARSGSNTTGRSRSLGFRLARTLP